ncbi:2'-5' RNA ligase family protein [Actinokineospora sp. HUAS TT18]|uniref:2'-5' RNA ligase family protein n=1 Tax=Actinokineospora sp. HUAS TT18 TaxID=3447451 RepID=UPI003F528E85
MTAFPADLPADLDDAEIIRAHDWQAFQNAGQMNNHWDRPGWLPGRRSYHWMLTFPDADEIQQLAKQCQTALDRPAFDLVPLDALHLTLGRVAFTDEIEPAAVTKIVDIARERCEGLQAFHLDVGPLAGSRGALRFTVSPWTQVLQLHEALSLATRGALDAPTLMDTSYFRPHLSIAYANTTVPIADALLLVTPLRAVPIVSTVVGKATLVELRREDGCYRYESLAEVSLRQATSPSPVRG